MSDDVLFSQEGPLGIITLNRPKALHALTLGMIQEIQQQLILWQDDPKVHAIVVRSTPSNAFCAGGDVRWLYQIGKEDPNVQRSFFWHEYRLNHYIHLYKKPYIALMDGITMGGGVGISVHGSHPVASERFSFAMPETSIGFFPDIGASHLLSRCPGALGLYLGLTGNRLCAEAAQAAGLITQIIPAARMDELITALQQHDLRSSAHERVQQILQDFALPLPKKTEFDSLMRRINQSFNHATVEDIFANLERQEDPWAGEMLHLLKQKAPLSLKLTLQQLHQAKNLSLAECLNMDFTLVQHFMQGHDFYEGVRALLVDKDKSPRWQPDQLERVSPELIAQYFRAINGEQSLF